MKKILVIDPSIMIHKIVQLAFPEDAYELVLSNSYPPENPPDGPLSLILLSADLPNQENVFALGGELKQKYNCPVLMMIPKFFEYDASLIRENNLDGTIGKPFTSDSLKEKCRMLEVSGNEIDGLEGLSPEELESITEEEFMLSEADLADIGEEDLADIDIPDSPPEAEEPETADMGDSQLSEPVSAGDEAAQSSGVTPGPEPAQDEPFQDMDMDEELDSIDFGDLEDGESLLDEPIAPDSDSLSEEETVSTTVSELAGAPAEEAPVISEDAEEAFAGEAEAETAGFDEMTEELVREPGETESVEEELVTGPEEPEGEFFGEPEKPTAVFAGEAETKDAEFDEMTEEMLREPGETETGSMEEGLSSPEESVSDTMIPPEVGPQTIREAVQIEGEGGIPSPEPETVPEEAEGEPLDDLLAEELPGAELVSEAGTTMPDAAMETEDELPDVNFAIEEEPQTVHVDEYQVEPPVVEEEITPLDISHADEDVELIPAPSSLSKEGLESSASLSDSDIRKIAEQVVAMLSDRVIRDIAWEVIPVVAEEIVRSRIRQLENEEVE